MLISGADDYRKSIALVAIAARVPKGDLGRLRKETQRGALRGRQKTISCNLASLIGSFIFIFEAARLGI